MAAGAAVAGVAREGVEAEGSVAVGAGLWLGVAAAAGTEGLWGSVPAGPEPLGSPS